jgi:hypothetical protein
MNNTSKPAQPHHCHRARHRARRRATPRPVPLTVWTAHATKPRGRPGAPPAVTAGPCSRHLPPWLASRIITEFSQPGDVVVVPDSGDAALLTAAARHERQTIGHTLSRSHAQRTRRTLAAELRPAQRRLVHVREGWPPPRPPASAHTSPAHLLIGLTPCRARHPGCAGPAVFTARVTSLCHTASQLLADDGTLIVVTAASPAVTAALDPVTSAAKAAERAGFAVRQLVAAVHVTPAAARTRAARCRTQRRAPASGTEGNAHRRQPGTQFDLLVLGKTRARARDQRVRDRHGGVAAPPPRRRARASRRRPR